MIRFFIKNTVQTAFYRQFRRYFIDLYGLCQENLTVFILEHRAGDGRVFKRIVDAEHGGAGAGHLRTVRAVGVHHGADIIDVEMLLHDDRLKHVAQAAADAEQIALLEVQLHDLLIRTLFDERLVERLIQLRRGDGEIRLADHDEELRRVPG